MVVRRPSRFYDPGSVGMGPFEIKKIGRIMNDESWEKGIGLSMVPPVIDPRIRGPAIVVVLRRSLCRIEIACARVFAEIVHLAKSVVVGVKGGRGGSGR